MKRIIKVFKIFPFYLTFVIGLWLVNFYDINVIHFVIQKPLILILIPILTFSFLSLKSGKIRRSFKEKILFYSIFTSFIIIYFSIFSTNIPIIVAQTATTTTISTTSTTLPEGCKDCPIGKSCSFGIVWERVWYCNELGWLCVKEKRSVCYGNYVCVQLPGYAWCECGVENEEEQCSEPEWELMCGPCPTGKICVNGDCVKCAGEGESCDGKPCCPSLTCVSGRCKSEVGPTTTTTRPTTTTTRPTTTTTRPTTTTTINLCGNGKCDQGETQVSCQQDCKTVVKLSETYTYPGQSVIVTVYFNDSRFNISKTNFDAQVNLSIDDKAWPSTYCPISGKRWRQDLNCSMGKMEKRGMENWCSCDGAKCEGKHQNKDFKVTVSQGYGYIEAVCTIPPDSQAGTHRLVALPIIYSEPIQLQQAKVEFIVSYESYFLKDVANFFLNFFKRLTGSFLKMVKI
ncbi:MAG: hypothetical protein QW472_01295 [Candidatus Aenigmatarchaeota archaeon]